MCYSCFNLVLLLCLSSHHLFSEQIKKLTTKHIIYYSRISLMSINIFENCQGQHCKDFFSYSYSYHVIDTIINSSSYFELNISIKIR